MRIFRSGSVLVLVVGLLYVTGEAAATPPDHLLRGIVDYPTELIDPPKDACGAALLDGSKTDQQVAHVCQGDPAYDAWMATTKKGAPCTSERDVITVDDSTQVLVRSNTGKKLGTTTLSTGALVKDQGQTCRFTFALTVRDAPTYRITVGTGNPVRFDKRDLQRHGWLAVLRYE
jgi:hypothetical protein